MIRFTRFSNFFAFSAACCLAGLFTSQAVALPSWDGPTQKGSIKTAVIGIADFDGDGINDFVDATKRNPTWYKGPLFNSSYTVGVGDGTAYGAGVADFNNDGWPDIVFTDGARDNGPGELFLYLHPGNASAATGTWQRITIYSIDVYHQNDLTIADMDGDGRLDVIVRTRSPENRVVIAFQNANINNWTVRTFATGETLKWPEGIAVGDIDGDGGMEMVLSGVYWDNPNGWRSGSPKEYMIDPIFVGEEVKSFVLDINGDGVNDVFMGQAEGNGKTHLAWYRHNGNPTGGASAWTRHIILDNVTNFHGVRFDDFDNDGDPDLLAGSSFTTPSVKIFYNSGNGLSWTSQSLPGGLYVVATGDLDNDGDIDFVGPRVFNEEVYLYRNQLADDGGVPDTAPVAPSGLSANAVSANTISLSWNDNSNNENTFVIERRTSSTSFTEVATVSANTESFSNADLDPDTSYTFRVLARNSNGDSGYSNTASATTDPAQQADNTAPSTPANFTGSANGTSIDLSWSSSTDNVAVTGYYLYADNNLAETLPANAKSFSYDTGGFEQTVAFKLEAFDAAGNRSSAAGPLNRTSAAQPVGGGFVSFQYNNGSGNTLSYQLYIPQNYDPAKSYPLVVSLHGAGERTNGNPKPTYYPTSAFAAASGQAIRPHFILHPWCPVDQQWVDTPFGGGSYDLSATPISNEMSAILAILDQIEAGYSIDPDRILISGLSMGGYGTLDALARQPNRFAAGLAIAGGGPASAIAAGAYADNLPVWLVHGDSDPIVPVEGSRSTVTALLDAGLPIRYTEHPGASHDTWTRTYDNKAVLEWFLNKSRNADTSGNQPPTVNAGPASVTIGTGPYSYSANGTASDAETPDEDLLYFWDIAEGATHPLFTPVNGASSQIAFSTLGAYRLRLAVSDGTHTSVDEIAFTVGSSSGLPDLLGQWDFDEGSGTKFSDTTGQNLEGDFTGAPWSSDTPSGTGNSFNVASGNVGQVPNSPFLAPSGNQFSFALWLKANSWSGTLLDKEGSFSFSQVTKNPVLRLSFANNGNGAWFQTDAPASGKWVHLTFTFDGTYGRYYFDGKEVYSLEKPMTLTNGTAPLLIGGQEFKPGSQGKPFDGLIDDLRLFNKALTPAQVAALADLNSEPEPTPYESWASTFFNAAELANPAVSGPTANPDGDSFTNFFERAFGGDPLSADSATLMPGIDSGMTSSTSLTIRFNQASDDLSYRIEQSDTLEADSWTFATPIGVTLDEATGETLVELALPGNAPSKRFFRVSVSE